MRPIDLHHLADTARFNRFHALVLFWCALIIVFDGYDLAVVGIALPSIMAKMGVDATHAWAAVRVPDGSWLALDPTNDQWVDERYVTVAWGREYADVPPLKGVIFTEAKTSTLGVAVDVVPL